MVRESTCNPLLLLQSCWIKCELKSHCSLPFFEWPWSLFLVLCQRHDEQSRCLWASCFFSLSSMQCKNWSTIWSSSAHHHSDVTIWRTLDCLIGAKTFSLWWHYWKNCGQSLEFLQELHGFEKLPFWKEPRNLQRVLAASQICENPIWWLAYLFFFRSVIKTAALLYAMKRGLVLYCMQVYKAFHYGKIMSSQRQLVSQFT